MKIKTGLLILIFVLTSFLYSVSKQGTCLSNDEVTSVVRNLEKAIEDYYFFTDRIDAINASFNEHISKGDYQSINNPNALAERLIVDFRALHDDKHFNVLYNPPVPENNANGKVAKPVVNPACFQDINYEKQKNFGFRNVDILPGNIGYIRIDSFSTAKEAFETAISAMKFVSNTQGLIFDMRYNNGGSAALVQFISTYLFDENLTSVLLNSTDFRGNTIPIQTWTLPYVPGKRIVDAPVYILTSKFTGSASEAFAFSMKTVNRATIIGEATAGAAHPVRFVDLGNGFMATIPFATISNPITNTDWEGVGVEPDIAIAEAQAYDTAYKMILDSLLVSATDETAKFKIIWALDGINAKTNTIELKSAEYNQFTGQYGDRTISLKSGKLYYKRTGPECAMQVISKDKFIVEGMDNFRIRFERDDNNKILNLVGMYEEGREDISPRTK